MNHDSLLIRQIEQVLWELSVGFDLRFYYLQHEILRGDGQALDQTLVHYEPRLH